MTLTEFLLARIAEDEDVARGASEHRTNTSSYNISDMYLRHGQVAGMTWRATYDEVYAWGDDERGKIAAVGNFGTTLTKHIARHDPSRVLAECEAKRQIIHQHGAGEGHECPDGFMNSAETDPHTGWENDCRTLKFLAAVYADHPDFREEWRV